MHTLPIWSLFPTGALFFSENHFKDTHPLSSSGETQKCLLKFGRSQPNLKLWNNIWQCVIHRQGNQTDVHFYTLGWVRQSKFITVFSFTFLYPYKNWYFSKVLILSPTLPHCNVLFSGPNAQDLWLWFYYSYYFILIKYFWPFFTFQKYKRQVEDTTTL